MVSIVCRALNLEYNNNNNNNNNIQDDIYSAVIYGAKQYARVYFGSSERKSVSAR